MRGLLQFLMGNSSTFLFILLEALCFFMIVRFNDKQQRIYFTTANNAVGYLHKKTDDLITYLSLGVQMRALKQENIALREALGKYARMQGDTLLSDTVMLGDFSLLSKDSTVKDSILRQRFSFIPAHVIDNSVMGFDNMLTLDRGRADGVQPNMGVITGDGVVGIVRQVSARYCTVLSLLHRQTRISAAIKGSGYFGTLKWDGKDPDFMELEAIPKHAEVEVGDTIQTSGYSNIFPKGILIGVVETRNINKGENFFEVKVKLNNDLGHAQNVYIVAFDDQEDFKKLEPARTR